MGKDSELSERSHARQHREGRSNATGRSHVCNEITGLTHEKGSALPEVSAQLWLPLCWDLESTAFLRGTDAYYQLGSKPKFSKPSSSVQASLIHRPVTPPGRWELFYAAQSLNTSCGTEQVFGCKAAIINCDSTLESPNYVGSDPTPNAKNWSLISTGLAITTATFSRGVIMLIWLYGLQVGAKQAWKCICLQYHSSCFSMFNQTNSVLRSSVKSLEDISCYLQEQYFAQTGAKPNITGAYAGSSR